MPYREIDDVELREIDDVELREILQHLRGLLSIDNEESRSGSISGENIVRNLPQTHARTNVIPGGTPGGCHPILVVAIGTHDSVEKRIYQAIEHAAVKCKEVNRYIVFAATKWDQGKWNAHRRSFKELGVRVILMMQPVETMLI